jgi:hypothetical protein
MSWYSRWNKLWVGEQSSMMATDLSFLLTKGNRWLNPTNMMDGWIRGIARLAKIRFHDYCHYRNSWLFSWCCASWSSFWYFVTGIWCLKPWLGLMIILGPFPASKSSICRFIRRRLNLTFSFLTPIFLSFTHSPDFLNIYFCIVHPILKVVLPWRVNDKPSGFPSPIPVLSIIMVTSFGWWLLLERRNVAERRQCARKFYILQVQI